MMKAMVTAALYILFPKLLLV